MFLTPLILFRHLFICYLHFPPYSIAFPPLSSISQVLPPSVVVSIPQAVVFGAYMCGNFRRRACLQDTTTTITSNTSQPLWSWDNGDNEFWISWGCVRAWAATLLPISCFVVHLCWRESVLCLTFVTSFHFFNNVQCGTSRRMLCQFIFFNVLYYFWPFYWLSDCFLYIYICFSFINAFHYSRCSCGWW